VALIPLISARLLMEACRPDIFTSIPSKDEGLLGP
jgi:hypothetical protein